MITALMIRLGIPKWGAIAMLCVLSALGALAYRKHLIHEGVAIEAVRRDAIDAQNRLQAQAELAQLNAQVGAARESLTAALAHLDQLKSDLDHEKEHSTVLQSDLAAGRLRQSVAISGACHPAQAGPAGGAVAAGLDPGSEPSTATLDGRVAADLEWARSTRNETIVALQACVAAYDAVKTATDAQQGE